MMLGINHAEVGSYLLKSWRLPKEIVEPVLWHHQPDMADNKGPEIAERSLSLFFGTQIASLQTDGLSLSTPSKQSLKPLTIDLAWMNWTF